MRIKLGPYKITPELWRRIQTLPGDNDEQRVLMALDFAIEAFNDPRLVEQRRKAVIEDELRRAEGQAMKDRPVQIVPDGAEMPAGDSDDRALAAPVQIGMRPIFDVNANPPRPTLAECESALAKEPA